MTDYYELLEVSPNASVEVIRAAYKAGIKRYHPDNYMDTKEKELATERIKLLNEALEVLTDEKSRLEYNQELAREVHFFGKDKKEGSYQNTGNFGNFGHSGGDNTRRNDAKSNDTWSNGTRQNDTRTNDANDLITYVEGLIVRCKDEVEYLELHDSILKGRHSETEKQQLLDILDRFTKIRLQQELEDEEKIEEYRGDVKSTKWGILFWMVVGIALTSKYWWAFWVVLALCIFAYHGAKEERDKLARAEYAVKHLSIYRMRGFKI